MYVYAPTGLGYALAQPAPKDPLSPDLREFLRQVRSQPEDNTLLLATATLHPLPADSRFWNNRTFSVGNKKVSLLEAYIMSGRDEIVRPALVGALQTISADFQKRDAAYRKQIEAAVALRADITNALSVLGRDPAKLQDEAAAVLLPSGSELEGDRLARIGRSVAKQHFSAKLADRMLHTLTFEVHYVTVARWLERYALLLLKRDPSFKRMVKDKLSIMANTSDTGFKRLIEDKVKALGL